MGEIASSALVIVCFTLIGGFFAAAETALISLRESQVANMATEHGKRGVRLTMLASDPNRFLAAGQVGVTLTGFLSAGYGSSTIVPKIAPIVASWGVSYQVADTAAFLVVTLIIVYVSLVIGELVPKRIALQRVESTALLVARPVDILAKIVRPFIWLLSASTNAVVRLLGLDPKAGRSAISHEELRGIVAGHEGLTETERSLIEEVFAAGDRELREVMLPRTEVEFLDASTLVSKAAHTIAGLPYSRYPVVRGSVDDVVGFVHVRDLLNPTVAQRSVRVGRLAREVARIPGSKRVLPALQQMRDAHQHLAIVVDEFGGTAGIVTLEDLVEELVGDIQDEYDATVTSTIARGWESEVVVDGLLNLDDLAEETGVELPEGPYETVAGFLVATLGELPTVGATVLAAGYVLTVSELDGRRASRIRIEPAIPSAPNESHS